MPEKILLFHAEQRTITKIQKLAENKRIRFICVDSEDYYKSLGDLAGIPSEAVPGEEEILPDSSVMVFCNVTEKHFNKLLFELRRSGISIDYKAVLTETNRYWTIGRLYPELVKERKRYAENE